MHFSAEDNIERTELLLHVLKLDVSSGSLSARPWIERLYASNDLRAAMPERASSLSLVVERRDSPRAMRIATPERAVFAETNLCTGRCYYDGGRFYSVSETEYWHDMEYDMDAHVIRANVGGIYLRNPQALVSNLIRPILQSFIIPFYGMKSLHGAVLTRGGHTLLLLGAGGAGKSTTTAQLIDDGYEFISDDGPFFTLVGREAYALSSLDYLHVTQNTLDMFPKLAPHVVGGRDHREKFAVGRIGLQRGDAWRRPLRVDAVVKLSRGPVAHPRITAYDKRALMQQLLSESMTVFRPTAFRDRAETFTAYSEFIFEVVTAVVRDTNAFEVEFANHHLPLLGAVLERLSTRGM